MNNVLSLNTIAGLLFIGGLIPYAVAVLRHQARPSKVSWIIWVTLDTITLIGMFDKHAVNGQIVAAVIGGWTLVGLALKYGIPGWTRLDQFCLGGAIAGIVLWVIFQDSNFGIAMSLAASFIGSFPTFNSAWGNPKNEDKLAWTILFVACLVAIAAIPKWTFANDAQPLVFLSVQTTMMYILYLHPLALKAKR